MTDYLDERAYQQRVVEAVNARLASGAGSTADRLAALLGVNRGVAYKRLQLKAYFTARELAILQDRLDLSVSPLAAGDLSLLTFRAPFGERPGRFERERYLGLMEDAQAQIAKLDPDGVDTRISVASSDMPVFYLFARPELAALKLYSFALETSKHTAKPLRLGDYLREHARDFERTSALSRGYLALGAVEIWSRTPLDNFLRQLLNLVELGLLPEAADVERAFDALMGLLEDVHRMIELGERASGQPFGVLCNEIHYTNSLILQEHPSASVLYATFDNPHYLVSKQPQAVAYFRRHFKYLQSMATPISRLGQLSAYRYLQLQHDRIDRARRKARLLLGNRALDLD